METALPEDPTDRRAPERSAAGGLRPHTVVLAWLASALAHAMLQLFGIGGYLSISYAVVPPSLMVIGGLAAAALLGDDRRGAFLAVHGMVCEIAIVLILATMQIANGGALAWLPSDPALAAAAAVIVFPITAVVTRRLGNRRRVALAALCVATFAFLALAWPAIEDGAAQSAESALLAQTSAETAPPAPAVPLDRLWEAQPALLDAAWSKAGASPDRARTIILGIAADGSQELFSREAGEASKALERRYGSRSPATLLLSNTQRDLLERPAGTRANFTRILARLNARQTAGDPLAVIYIAGHGAADGTVATRLPGFEPLEPFSARFVAKALAASPIKRRIVIVSACFAGSWTKSLANPDTIVIAAAAADRTSFGCDDSRELTVFGESILRGPLRDGASWKQVFAALRRKVAEEEKRFGVEPSDPQAFIGRNMRAEWERKP